MRLKFVNSPMTLSRLFAARAEFAKLPPALLSKAVTLLILVTLSSFAQLALSQSLETSTDSQVSDLLAEIESKNRTRSIFLVNSRQKIADIAFDSRYRVVKKLGKWSIVEFKQQTVPGWVSSDYVNISGGRARVKVNNLNMRLRPSLNSDVMVQLNQGYISQVIGRRSGFVRVLAPKSYRAAIFSGSDTDAKLSGSPSLNRVRPQDTSARAPVTDALLALKDKPASSTLSDQQASQQPSNGSLRAEQARAEQARAEQSAELRQNNSERLHIIAPGDAVSLLVFGEGDLSIQNVRVPQSGRVSFPLIGPVLVAGQTIPQVEASVAELLAQGYVKNPRLSVTMFSYRPVFIRGAIRQTGSFPFSEGLTVGKAIALAGGSKTSAKRNGVSILREGKVVESSLTVDSQIEVQSGDVITIDEEVGVQEGDATYIYLHGEVASPGEYQFRRGLTVEKAIVLAGGFTLRGSRKKISVTRYVDVDADQEPEKLKKVKLYTPIKPGDIINVGATWF